MTDSAEGVKEAAGLASLRAYAEAETAARLRVAERWHTGVLIRDVSRIPGSQPVEFYAVLDPRRRRDRQRTVWSLNAVQLKIGGRYRWATEVGDA